MMGAKSNKTLMRCLGEFVGYILNSFRRGHSNTTHEVHRTVEEHTDSRVTLRRTTIDEIEYQAEDTQSD